MLASAYLRVEIVDLFPKFSRPPLPSSNELPPKTVSATQIGLRPCPSIAWVSEFLMVLNFGLNFDKLRYIILLRFASPPPK